MVQAVKDADTLHGMHYTGQSVGFGSRYISSTYAHCPVCGGEAFVTRQEHGPTDNKGVFRCSSCFREFEPNRGDILWF